MDRAKFLSFIGWVMIVAGVVNLVLAIVDISSGASVANNGLAAAMGIVLTIAGSMQVANKGRARR